MPIIPITSPQDERIAAFHCIRERDIVGRDQNFIAEGRVVIDVLLCSPYKIESLLVSDKQNSFIDELPAPIRETTPVYVASQNVMDTIVGFPIHRGLLALGKKPAYVSANDLLSPLPQNAVVLGLVGMANHDNMGGIFRNAAAFGCAAIMLDSTCCDPFYRKALRVSVGGVLKVPFTHMGNTAAMIESLQQQGFKIYALSPAGKTALSAVPKTGRVALLLGTEGTGLPASILNHIETVHIPIASDFDSLNVATTSGIALYEMTRA